MGDKELRLECLKIAAELVKASEIVMHPDEVTVIAAQILAYVEEGKLISRASAIERKSPQPGNQGT